VTVPAASGESPAGPAGPCWTRVYYSTPPQDLRTWAQAAAELADGPDPMSERDLRRKYKATGRRTWRVEGERAEHVSMSDVWEFHRDLRRGWLKGRGPGAGSA
jgi:hypothetical protein